MLHILLEILKIIGILILAMLIFCLVILFIALFVPIRYKVFAKKNENIILVDGRVYWFFHMVEVIYNYPNNYCVIKIFGITTQRYKKILANIKSFFLKFNRREKSKKKKVSSKGSKELVKNETFQSKNHMKKSDGLSDSNNQRDILKKDEKVDNLQKNTLPNEKIVNSENVKDENAQKKAKSNICKRFCDIIKKGIEILKDFIQKLKEIVRLYKNKKEEFEIRIEKIKEFINDERNREAFIFLKKEVIGLIKYIKPTEIDGWIRFGFDDPSTTGKVLGLCGVFMPVYKDSLRIIPEFEEKVIQGEIFFKGRIRLYRLLIVAIKVLINENVMSLYRRVLK